MSREEGDREPAMLGDSERVQHARRAQRLLRWYPRCWRARYADEFAELLMAGLAGQPRSWRFTADVARGGLLARLAGAGLTSNPLDPADGTKASLATLACAVAAFLAAGAAMWSQLTVSWQWSPPASPATTVAMLVMSAAMLLFLLLALLAAAPVVVAAIRAKQQGRSQLLRTPGYLVIGGALVLIVGGRHFGNVWPGTGGYWPGRLVGDVSTEVWRPAPHLVPGGIAAFSWACTLSVSAYWAHPSELASFPAPEVAWMVISPVAIGCLIIGVAKLIRRIPLTPRVLRYEAWLGRVAGLGVSAVFGAALCWVASPGAASLGLFQTGAIDVAMLAVMAIALVTGWQALHYARTGSRPASPPTGAQAGTAGGSRVSGAW